MGSGFKYPRGFHRDDFPPLQSGDLFHHPKVLLKIQLLKLVVTRFTDNIKLDKLGHRSALAQRAKTGRWRREFSKKKESPRPFSSLQNLFNFYISLESKGEFQFIWSHHYPICFLYNMKLGIQEGNILKSDFLYNSPIREFTSFRDTIELTEDLIDKSSDIKTIFRRYLKKEPLHRQVFEYYIYLYYGLEGYKLALTGEKISRYLDLFQEFLIDFPFLLRSVIEDRSCYVFTDDGTPISNPDGLYVAEIDSIEFPLDQVRRFAKCCIFLINILSFFKRLYQ